MEAFLSYIGQMPVIWAILALALAAIVEYIFPPFPGDMIIVFGGFLVGSRVLPFGFAFSALVAGSLLGLSIVYWTGYSLRHRYEEMKSRMRENGPSPKARLSFFPFSMGLIEQAERAFSKWGDWIILVNRFIPVIRSVFFFAAGILHKSAVRVFLFGGIATFLWVGFLMGLGIKAGNNWRSIGKILNTYNHAIIAIGLVLLAFFLFRFAKNRKTRMQVESQQEKEG